MENRSRTAYRQLQASDISIVVESPNLAKPARRPGHALVFAYDTAEAVAGALAAPCHFKSQPPMTTHEFLHPVLTVSLCGCLLAAAPCSRADERQLPVAEQLPLRIGTFDQQVHHRFTTSDGLPADNVLKVAVDPHGIVYVRTADGDARLEGDRWMPLPDPSAAPDRHELLSETTWWHKSLTDHIAEPSMVRDVAQQGDEFAVAAANGLFIGNGKKWKLALPQQGHIRWAPVDVRTTTYDQEGRLWFACPQGVGCRSADGKWKLFTGTEGLPFNDFTCMAAGPKGVWFGTTNGAIRYFDEHWEFRQGGRWLVDNHVQDVAVAPDGSAWLATAGGVSHIAFESTSLSDKARFYEEEIDRYHRRTRFGYVNPADLTVPGDRSTAVPAYSDNDGFNTGLYLTAMSLAWAVTGDERYRQYAHNSFRALAFLSEVTQGGPHPAPAGFPARNVIPITETDPNQRYDLPYDIGRNQRDALWKIIQPRLPEDASGEWYWKCDSSSDELDGHFLGYAAYYDHVCESQEDKEHVRVVVRRIIDHLLTHNYCLVDHDGRPTRWAHFAPDDLNRNPAWVAERGLNSLSILTYLTVAHHITGDQTYRDEYLKLALDHGYGMNGMTQPKFVTGPRSPGHQPDDNMAFMNYYHLIRYETDPQLLSMYQFALWNHWPHEKAERNAFTNFIYGACALGKTRTDQWGTRDLSPPLVCFEDAADTLRRYPLDLVEWPMSNAHRTDLVRAGDHGHNAETGWRTDGYVFPVDERQETYWDWDPWELTSGGQGLRLRPGFHYLLAWYLGRYHGFIAD